MCVLTPSKLLYVRAINLARLKTTTSECHKGVGDVIMASQSEIIFLNIAFPNGKKRFSA